MFLGLLGVLVAWGPFAAWADGIVPLVSDEPVASRKLSFDEFQNITRLLAGGRMAPHMKCDLKVRTYGEDRVFSDGRHRVEILEVEYYPRGLFADTKLKVLIPAELATYGSKVVSSHWSGEGEDIKIESHDSYDHWLRFTHDGKGRLVGFVLGNNLGTYPCMVK